MTREEHLAWSKTRALEYVAMGDLIAAHGSFSNDLTKFEGAMYAPETMRRIVQEGLGLAASRGPGAAERMKLWIEGFR